MPKSKFGDQPVRLILLDLGWSRTRLAKRLGVTRGHMNGAVYGYTRPHDNLREHLPKLLKMPLHDLFTPAALAKPYDPKHDWRKAGL